MTVTFDAVTGNADAIEVQVSLNGMPVKSQTWPRKVDAGPATRIEIEVDFPHGYHAGDTLEFTLSAVKGGKPIATFHTVGPLPPTCGTFTVDLTADGGVV